MNRHTGIDFPYAEELEKRGKIPLTDVFEGLRNPLRLLRDQRGFAPRKFLEDKVKKINEFFEENDLDCAVVGLSGGVDSALVFKLLVECSKREGSPLKKIVALAMPICGNGTTGQSEALLKARILANQTSSEKVEFRVCDLTSAYSEYVKCVSHTSPWANGQLASVVRTPMFYYTAAIMQDLGYRSIVVGTTNRDEGSYIGFFGKASDGMVDLQPIADMHKSEVYSLAEILEVPSTITKDRPRGDVWDGKCDEEMIGAPYWFLELYLLHRDFHDPLLFQNSALSQEEKELCELYINNIENLHRKNSHKYKVGSPAHFVDVLKRETKGGW